MSDAPKLPATPKLPKPKRKLAAAQRAAMKRKPDPRALRALERARKAGVVV